MAIQYLKKAAKQPTSGEADTRRIVGEILDNIRAGGEQRVRSYAAELDKWQGDIVVSPEAIAAAGAKVPARLKQDIDFALTRVRDFAQRPRDSVREFEAELSPGLFAGQRLIPLKPAGCYVPGGRYAHFASALSSLPTPQGAGGN